MIDPVTALRTLLQQQGALTSLTRADVDYGIYRSDTGFPEGSTPDAPTAPNCVMIEGNDAAHDPSSPRISPNCSLRIYGSTGIVAMQIFRALTDVFVDEVGMQRGRRVIVGPARKWLLYGATVRLVRATREPTTNWPVVLATLNARMSAREVA